LAVLGRRAKTETNLCPNTRRCCVFWNLSKSKKIGKFGFWKTWFLENFTLSKKEVPAKADTDSEVRKQNGLQKPKTDIFRRTGPSGTRVSESRLSLGEKALNKRVHHHHPGAGSPL